jgi:hypothetical protein
LLYKRHPKKPKYEPKSEPKSEKVAKPRGERENPGGRKPDRARAARRPGKR